MRKAITLALLCLTGCLAAMGQGMPFIRNYYATEYKGHNQNFDIITGIDGTVYVANFEGLLYFDNAQWHMIHTPGVTRITAVFRDSKNTIWTGGYNYIGYLTTSAKGELKLKTLQGANFHGEVNWIWESNGSISFLTSASQIYRIVGNKPVLQPHATTPKSGFSHLSEAVHVNQVQQLDNGLQALATNGGGVIITDQNGRKLYSITEDDGLCSNNVAHITYNKMGQLWGATDNGLFAISIPSVFSRFTPTEGLRGEVLALQKLGNSIYAGTLSGLYRQEGRRFVPVKGITHTTWQLTPQGDHLLAATMDGVFRIDKNGDSRQLTTASVLSLMADGNNFYSGEMDGLYYNYANGTRQKRNNAEKVVRILKDNTGSIWLQTIYGKIWKSRSGYDFEPFTSENDNMEVATLVDDGYHVRPIMANAKKPFPYPQYSYADKNEVIWLTNNKGRDLYAYRGQKADERLSTLVEPFKNYSFRAMLHDGDNLWAGGERGLFTINTVEEPIQMQTKPRVLFRTITLREDSVLWGGYGPQPQSLKLNSNERHLRVHYSLNFPVTIGKPEFRYRVNDNKWSQWDSNSSTELINQPYGTNVFEVQGRDAFGRTTDVARLTVSYNYPLYMRWYMIVLYIIAIGLFFFLLTRWRLRRLEKEKVRLESLVNDRTAEVVRLEKMATVGKLTQGLIDRILNPLNYILNFTKLSQGLIKDVTANIEDEQEHMDKENYEDTMDVLDMLDANLQKVGEHGANTTRTLKAMEEMLKHHAGTRVPMDLCALLHQQHEMLQNYYKKEIAEHHITISFQLPDAPLMINGNAEQLNQTLMNLLSNAIYALCKKAQKDEGAAQQLTIKVALAQQGNAALLTIRDTGTGISANIVDKIFDPFFTTKTTGEASGVGLYLSKEIVQNHGGDITVQSVKQEYTEFTITLPIL